MLEIWKVYALRGENGNAFNRIRVDWVQENFIKFLHFDKNICIAENKLNLSNINIEIKI